MRLPWAERRIGVIQMQFIVNARLGRGHAGSKKNDLIVVGLAGIKGSLHFIQRHLTIQLLIMGQVQSEQSGAFSELFPARILDQGICQPVVLLEGR